MAAALAKVIRGRRSGASAQLLLPAMGRRILQQGQWSNSGPSRGYGALPFGGRRVLSQNHKHKRSEQFSGKRFMSDAPFDSGSGNRPWIIMNIAYALGLVLVMPPSVRSGKWLFNDK